MQPSVAERRPQSFDRVLSSMCTQPHPAARRAAERFLAANPGDPATYETIAELEREAVASLAEITGLADAVGVDGDTEARGNIGVRENTDSHGDIAAHGYVTSGGSESNIQAVRSARERAESDDPVVVAPESAHFSFHKAASVLGVELRTVPTDDAGRADVDAVAAAVDDDVALVVAVAGSTEYGRVDPIPAMADLAVDAGVPLHVDAAWGGFHLPFSGHDWGFDVDGVETLTIDPHKVGRAAVPAGGLLARDPTALDALAVDTPYLETASQASLTGTRSGAGVASAAAAMDELWPDGYRAEYERASELAAWFAEELRSRELDVVDPELPLVAFDLPRATFEAVRERGWRISRTGAGEARVVVMPHVTRGSLSAFLDDLDDLDAPR
ncbi:tyrosine decarboxylase MfnA [Halobaculum magnesiiphilum]|uniref:Probable L-aspartate decarboxylase n=1 Tax=Halobaculum magnesiiphilum TaxID=1017351 RepID=A0A8T8WCS9_9EURY|nr:tyrosine decarboxylase MfnA [Halobaculum magnesiiphilum]QZP37631.1 tyrosine decarboxylase MfnA [Halobaculum magnesiiphilum]